MFTRGQKLLLTTPWDCQPEVTGNPKGLLYCEKKLKRAKFCFKNDRSGDDGTLQSVSLLVLLQGSQHQHQHQHQQDECSQMSAVGGDLARMRKMSPRGEEMLLLPMRCHLLPRTGSIRILQLKAAKGIKAVRLS